MIYRKIAFILISFLLLIPLLLPVAIYGAGQPDSTDPIPTSPTPGADEIVNHTKHSEKPTPDILETSPEPSLTIIPEAESTTLNRSLPTNSHKSHTCAIRAFLTEFYGHYIIFVIT